MEVIHMIADSVEDMVKYCEGFKEEYAYGHVYGDEDLFGLNGDREERLEEYYDLPELERIIYAIGEVKVTKAGIIECLKNQIHNDPIETVFFSYMIVNIDKVLGHLSYLGVVNIKMELPPVLIAGEVEPVNMNDVILITEEGVNVSMLGYSSHGVCSILRDVPDYPITVEDLLIVYMASNEHEAEFYEITSQFCSCVGRLLHLGYMTIRPAA